MPSTSFHAEEAITVEELKHAHIAGSIYIYWCSLNIFTLFIISFFIIYILHCYIIFKIGQFKQFYWVAGNCMFKVNNRNTRTRREICSKLTIKTSEGRHWTYFTPCSRVSIGKFEQVNASWVGWYEANAHWEQCQTSKTEIHTKIINGFWLSFRGAIHGTCNYIGKVWSTGNWIKDTYSVRNLNQRRIQNSKNI